MGRRPQETYPKWELPPEAPQQPTSPREARQCQRFLGAQPMNTAHDIARHIDKAEYERRRRTAPPVCE